MLIHRKEQIWHCVPQENSYREHHEADAPVSANDIRKSWLLVWPHWILWVKCTGVNDDFCTLDNRFTHSNYETIKDKMDIFKIHFTQISEGLCSFSLNGRDASGTKCLSVFTWIKQRQLFLFNKLSSFFVQQCVVLLFFYVSWKQGLFWWIVAMKLPVFSSHFTFFFTIVSLVSFQSDH